MDDPADTTLFMERQQFFNGQRLFASDLQDLEGFHRGMRELHNRSLHQPGIGNGYAVIGAVGDRDVQIGPGYALDSDGREIVLTAAHTEQVPPVSAEDDGESVYYDLTVSYPSDHDLEEAETRDGVCLPRGVVRLEVEPIFCWVRLERGEADKLHARDATLKNDLRYGRKIRLARVEIKECQIKSLSVKDRRNARPNARPYIACGRVEPAWERKSILPFLLKTTIDTSCAGFKTVPCYEAHLEGPRLLNVKVTNTLTVTFFAEGILSIHDAQPTRFDVHALVLALPLSDRTEDGVTDFISTPDLVITTWKIVWMGVE
ncbi:MAG: hypothetical protein V3T84_01335 [Phycisphaerales bacterium]